MPISVDLGTFIAWRSTADLICLVEGATVGDVMVRLSEAINSHDLDAFVALFHNDYQSDQPAHPSRAFRGADQVRANWSSVFAGVPDLTASLLLSTTLEDDTEVGEWYWHGTHLDGTVFAMRGVIVAGIRDDRIAWGRLYMEPVEADGADIDAMVRETYRPPEAPTSSGS